MGQQKKQSLSNRLYHQDAHTLLLFYTTTTPSLRNNNHIWYYDLSLPPPEMNALRRKPHRD